MKNQKSLMIVIIFVAICICSSTSFADYILWQIGESNGVYTEFTSNPGTFVSNFTYDFGVVNTATPTKVTSSTPVYLFSVPDSPWSSYFATNALNINFELSINYDELYVNFGRFGREYNTILLDGTVVTSFSGPGEGDLGIYRVPLYDVSKGTHTLTIAYAGGDPNNGNYFDYIQLENGRPSPQPAPVPEPATILLLGAGLIGLARYGRKRLN
jgi:hypothetical protein